MNELVSIIIPIYNSEKSLDRCLNSILLLEYQNYEVILVNDGSQDDSEKICRKYVNLSNKFKLFNIENNGVSHARNFGIHKANGEYILFVDSDDYVLSNHIQNMLPIEDEDLVYAGYEEIINDHSTNSINLIADTIQSNLWINSMYDFWMKYPLYAVWRGCYNKSIIKNNQIMFDEHIFHAEDILFNLYYLKNCKKIRLSDINTYYYDNSNTKSLVNKFCEDRIDIGQKECELIERVSNKKEFRIRWYVWHEVLNHFEKKGKSKDLCKSKIATRKIKDCYNNEYFRESIPFIRKNGSLDQKIETYFMNYRFRKIFNIILIVLKVASYIINMIFSKN